MEDYAELLTKNTRTNRMNLLVQYVVIVADILLLGLFLKNGFGLFSIVFFLILVFISSYGNILFLKKRFGTLFRLGEIKFCPVIFKRIRKR